MLKNLLLLNFLLITLMIPRTSFAQEQISPAGRESALNLSKEIIGGINEAYYLGEQRRFTLEMMIEQGYFETIDLPAQGANSFAARWLVPQGALMRIEFTIQDGKVQEPIVHFIGSPDPLDPSKIVPVKLRLSTGDIPLNDINYGSPNPGDESFLKPQQIANVGRHLHLSTNPSDLFFGRPFAWASARFISVAPEDTPTPHPTKFFTRITYPAQPDMANISPIQVSWKENRTLHLAPKSADNKWLNEVTLGKGTSAKIKAFQYTVEQPQDQVYLSMTDVDLPVNSGKITAQDLSLLLRQGSRLAFNSLFVASSSVWSSAPCAPPGVLTEAMIADQKGEGDESLSGLKALLDSGSLVTFGNAVRLTTSSESELAFHELHFRTDESAMAAIQARDISTPSGKRLDLLAGELKLGDVGTLKVAPLLGPNAGGNQGGRNAEMKLRSGEGQWGGGAGATAAAYRLKLSDIKAPVADGRLVLTPNAGAVEIDEGSWLTSPELTLGGDNSAGGLTGFFSAVSLKLKAGPQLDLNDKVSLVPTSQTLLTASDSDNPLTVAARGTIPSGSYSISNTFASARLTSDTTFSLGQGSGRFNIRSSNGLITVPSIENLSAKLASAHFAFGRAGYFDLNAERVGGNITLDQDTGRYQGTISLSGASVTGGRLRLSPTSEVNVTSIRPLPDAKLTIGSGPINTTTLVASVFQLAVTGTPKLSLVPLFSLEDVSGAFMSGEGAAVKFGPDADLPQGEYKLTASGRVRAAEAGRVPLVIDQSSVEMKVQSGSDGISLSQISMVGRTEIVSNNTSIPFRIGIRDGRYSRSPAESVDAVLYGVIAPGEQMSDAARANSWLTLTSYKKERSQKTDPKLFQVTFLATFADNIEVPPVKIKITAEGTSTTETLRQKAKVNFKVPAGKGVYNYKDDNLGEADKPNGYSKENKFVPYANYQELLRARVGFVNVSDRDCKAMALLGTQASLSVDASLSLTINNGRILFGVDDNGLDLGMKPLQAVFYTCNGGNEPPLGNKIAMIADGLNFYLQSHPLKGKLKVATNPATPEGRADQLIGGLLALSFADTITGTEQPLIMTMGKPR